MCQVILIPMMKTYEIRIFLKEDVLDPEARQVSENLEDKYGLELEDLKISKVFTIHCEEKFKNQLQDIAKNFLSNPVSQNFRIREVKEN